MFKVLTTDWDGSQILVPADFDEQAALRYSAQFISYSHPHHNSGGFIRPVS